MVRAGAHPPARSVSAMRGREAAPRSRASARSRSFPRPWLNVAWMGPAISGISTFTRSGRTRAGSDPCARARRPVPRTGGPGRRAVRFAGAGTGPPLLAASARARRGLRAYARDFRIPARAGVRERDKSVKGTRTRRLLTVGDAHPRSRPGTQAGIGRGRCVRRQDWSRRRCHHAASAYADHAVALRPCDDATATALARRRRHLLALAAAGRCLPSLPRFARHGWAADL